MKVTDYKITVRWSESDNAFLAEVPALMNCIAFGHSPQVAICEVLQAADRWLLTTAHGGEMIPCPDVPSFAEQSLEELNMEICKHIGEAFRQLDYASYIAAFRTIPPLTWGKIDSQAQAVLALLERGLTSKN